MFNTQVFEPRESDENHGEGDLNNFAREIRVLLEEQTERGRKRRFPNEFFTLI